jgi:FAD:protein FMN transferase
MNTQTRRSFLNLVARHTSPADDYWLHVHRVAMACRFEVTLPKRKRDGVDAAIDALNEVDALETQLTVFRESSEVSKINREAASRPVVVEQSLFDLLLLCKKLYQETDGAFDITSGPLTRCWGFLRRAGRVPENEELQQAQELVGSDKLLLDHDTRTIRFAKPGVEINLGSIGKGYALDRVANQIQNRIHTALLNAGSSSIRAIGAGVEDSGWLVGLRSPLKTHRIGQLRIRDCALSTTGTEEQYFEHEGRRYGHVIDPRSGRPADNVRSVTVVADSAAVSDGLATAFFVGGRTLAEHYCKTHRNVLVILLESNSETPLVMGKNTGVTRQMF